MTSQEVRQANRIIRNAKEIERIMFELVEELQAAAQVDGFAFEWLCTADKLQSIEQRLPLLKDLVKNIRQEVNA